MQLTFIQNQYKQITAKEGAFISEPQDTIQGELQQYTNKLSQYQSIRIKSEISDAILLVASHLSKGALLTSFSISYDQGDTVGAHVTIDMHGDVINGDSNMQIAMVNQVYSDLKNDKTLSRFVSNVNLISFNPEQYNGQQATGFNIHCA